MFARYARTARGAWRLAYVVGSATALYVNVFVGVVQAFLKVSPLHALAPQQTEPSFVAAQVAVLVLFVVLTIFCLKRFQGASIHEV
jgi:hypothetical protein